MKKTLVIALVSALSLWFAFPFASTSRAESPAESWVARYPAAGPSALAVDSSGSVHVAGTYERGYVVSMYDANGRQLWAVRQQGDYLWGPWMGVDTNSNTYVLMVRHSSKSPFVDGFVVAKYDRNGHRVWVVRGPSDCDAAAGLAVDMHGNVYVSGSGALVKYDTGGNQLWVAHYGDDLTWSLPSVLTMPGFIALDRAGNIYVTGGALRSPPDVYPQDWAFATAKYDANGTRLWVRWYDGPGDWSGTAQDVALDSNGNVYVYGFARWGMEGTYDYALVKYDGNGNQQWAARHGHEGEPSFMAVDPNGNAYVAELVCDSSFGPCPYLTMKYDTAGNQVWARRYDGSDWAGFRTDNIPSAVAADSEGNVYVTGASERSSYDYATVKYDTNGNQLWVGLYDGPAGRNDGATALAVDSYGNVYVTGASTTSTDDVEIATVKYGASQPGITILNARMVSPSVLGIDAEVTFPKSDPEQGPRYVELTATVNGQPVREQIDVTDLVGPGETASIEWVYTQRLQIDLVDTHDDLGNSVEVQRFADNQEFKLEAVAWSPTSGRSKIAGIEVRIPLPVIVVHGWTGETLIASIPLRIYESLIDRLTAEGYTTDDSWYKTIWFQRYNSDRWSPREAAAWLDGVVGAATSTTYANQVNIIGHSLGGLVGRYYAANWGGATKVHKLIMVGTPNKGSSKFYIQTSGMSIDLVRGTLETSPLAQWLIPAYEPPLEALRDRMNNPLESTIPNSFPNEPAPQGVAYYSIYNMAIDTPGGLIVDPYRGWYRVIDQTHYQTGGDGVVPWMSADLDSAINIPVVVSSGHAFLTKDPEVQNAILQALEDQ